MMDDLDNMFCKLNSLKTMLYDVLSCMDERLCDCIKIDIIEYAGLIFTINQSIRVRNLELKRNEKTIEDVALKEVVEKIVGGKRHIEQTELKKITDAIVEYYNSREEIKKVTCMRSTWKYDEEFYGIFMMMDRDKYREVLNFKKDDYVGNENFFVSFFINNVFKEVFVNGKHEQDGICYIERIYQSIVYQTLSDFLFEFHMPSQEILTYLSALKYEGANNYSKMVFYVAEDDIKLRIALDSPVQININNARNIRKLMEIATEDFYLEIKGGEVKSIVQLLCADQAWIIEFKNYLNWRVLFDGCYVVEYKNGEIKLPNLLDKHKYIQKIMYQHFEERKSKEQIDALCKTIEYASVQKHGTSIIISDDPEKEVERLCKAKRGFKIEKFNILNNESLVEHITSIDGAVIIDSDGYCYGVGMIVDGQAVVQGDNSRGARYNSIYNYIVQKYIQGNCYVAAIISEDGMINIISTEIDRDNFRLLE